MCVCVCVCVYIISVTNIIHSTAQVSLVLCNTSDAEFQASYEETYQLFKIYQMTIHKETEEDSDRKQVKQQPHLSKH